MDDIVAIDGPAGSGKSTVARLVAKRLSFTYIDTGAMYRALTLKAIRKGMNLQNENALVSLAKRTILDIVNDKDGNLKVLLDNEDVAHLIRTPELTASVSYLARVEGVRKKMVKLQQRIGKRGKCVFEGRDITTAVFPKANYKFYLDAGLEERANRRYKDLLKLGVKASHADVEKDIEVRDHKDKTRSAGPLRKASDAIYIDTTTIGIEEVVDKVCFYIK